LERALYANDVELEDSARPIGATAVLAADRLSASDQVVRGLACGWGGNPHCGVGSTRCGRWAERFGPHEKADPPADPLLVWDPTRNVRAGDGGFEWQDLGRKQKVLQLSGVGARGL